MAKQKKIVYVRSKEGEALMPCTPRKARILLQNQKAKLVSHKPFVIQLHYGSSTYKQPIILGIDSGYDEIGFSAVTAQKELLGGEYKLLENMYERV